MKKLENISGTIEGQKYFVHPEFWDDIFVIEDNLGFVNITNIRGYTFFLNKTPRLIEILEEKEIINKGDITL